jgi:hypothetical protein
VIPDVRFTYSSSVFSLLESCLGIFSCRLNVISIDDSNVLFVLQCNLQFDRVFPSLSAIGIKSNARKCVSLGDIYIYKIRKNSSPFAGNWLVSLCVCVRIHGGRCIKEVIWWRPRGAICSKY